MHYSKMRSLQTRLKFPADGLLDSVIFWTLIDMSFEVSFYIIIIIIIIIIINYNWVLTRWQQSLQ